MDIKYLIEQYINNIREVFEQKITELEMFSDRQAAEIETLTNKLIAMGILVVILIVVVIILLIVLKSSKKKRKKRELREREEQLRREERRLQEERRRFEEERRNARVAASAYDDGPEYHDGYTVEYDNGYEAIADDMYGMPEGYREPVNGQSEYPKPNVEYGHPSRRIFSGRQKDDDMWEDADRTTQYYDGEDWISHNEDEWK